MAAAVPVQVLDDPAQAAAILDPLRARLLESLREPDSAAGVARRLGLPRQRVNHHVRELEQAGLVEFVEARKKRNCTERVVRATATHYLVSPDVLGALGRGEPGDVRDRFSWAHLVTTCGRAIRELATLRKRANAAKKKLPTFTLSVDVRFKDAASLNRFTEDLANEVARLAAAHHDEASPGGRLFRVFLGSYPAITKSSDEQTLDVETKGDRDGGDGEGSND